MSLPDLADIRIKTLGYNQAMTRKYLLKLPQSILNARYNEKRPSQYVGFGLFGATLLFGLCVFIRTDSLRVNYGLSYFGIFWSTIVPYTAGFLLYAFCLWKASDIQLENSRRSLVLAWTLRIMSIQMIGLLLTPYDRLYNIHVFFGAGLFSLQLVLSFLLLKWLLLNWINVALVFIEFLSGLVSLYYLPQSRGLLLQTQVIFQLAFGYLLIRTLSILETSSIEQTLQQTS